MERNSNTYLLPAYYIYWHTWKNTHIKPCLRSSEHKQPRKVNHVQYIYMYDMSFLIEDFHWISQPYLSTIYQLAFFSWMLYKSEYQMRLLNERNRTVIFLSRGVGVRAVRGLAMEAQRQLYCPWKSNQHFFIGWFPNHHFLYGGWLPGLLYFAIPSWLVPNGIAWHIRVIYHQYIIINHAPKNRGWQVWSLI